MIVAAFSCPNYCTAACARACTTHKRAFQHSQHSGDGGVIVGKREGEAKK